MKIGAAKHKITPKEGIELAGFGIPEGKDRNNIGLHDDLHVTVLALQHLEGKILIICADLIGFGASFTANVKEAISEEFGVQESDILLNASHTHSGPQTLEVMLESVGRKDEAYMNFLFDRILSCTEEALSTMEEGELFTGKALCGFNVNRRLVIEGRGESRPNEEGPVDKEVTVFQFIVNDKTKCVLFSYACHPSTVHTKFVSADYPGVAKNIIEESFQGHGQADVIAMFMQGCCGDIRVRTIDGDRFRPGTFEDVDCFGRELGEAVLSVVHLPHEKESSPDTVIKTNEVKISSKILHLDLPLAPLPLKSDLETLQDQGNHYQREWASKIVRDYTHLPDSIPYTIQKLTLADNMSIVALSGETCIEYALYVKAKKHGDTVAPVGYSNGLPCYIPTANMFLEGGYEPDSSTIYFSLPTSLNPSVEKIILEKLDLLI